MPGLRDILDAATPGPWTHYDGPYDDWDRVVLDHFTSEGPYVWEASHDKPTVLADARLIALAPELAALVLDGEDVIAGLMEIAEIAMPDSYFEDDSRTTTARLWLSRLSRLGAGDSNPNEKEQTT